MSIWKSLPLLLLFFSPLLRRPARLLLILLLAGGGAGGEAYSQQQTNFWHFGTLAGLDFSSGAPVALTNAALNTTEGCASASDAAGNLLFYTNGVDVWNKANAIMPNGTGLQGDVSTTQSALIVPVPGSGTLYYIFTVDDVVGPNGLKYSIVDMTLQGGNGNVTAKNTFLQSNVTEKLCAVYHCNGTDIWVMAHQWNSNNFYAYLVTAAGINAPVMSAAGTTHSGNSINVSVGQMKFSPDGSRLADAVGYKDTVDIFDFDTKTGVVSNPLSLPLGNHVYGIEFSPDNSKLYVSYYQIGNAGWLAQFDLNAANVSASQTVVGTSFDPNYFYSLQLGPDMKVYASAEVTPWLAVINSPNTPGIGCNYAAQGVNVDPNSTGNYCMLGLPGFIASYFNAGFPNPPTCSTITAGIQSSDSVICQNDCINFTDLSTGSPTSWQWSFPGATPLSSIDQNPLNVCFASAGTFTVTLVASDGISSDTISHAIIVLPLPTANAGPDVIITVDTSTVLNASGGGTYLWIPSTGLSCTTCANPTADPSITTTYSVIVTGANGCTSMDAVTVFIENTPCSDPYVPNAFSPNEDSENDVLQLYFADKECFTTFKIEIYDQWGELIFESADPAFSWDGSFGAKLMNTQVLAYSLRATLRDGQEISKKGNVSVMR